MYTISSKTVFQRRHTLFPFFTEGHGTLETDGEHEHCLNYNDIHVLTMTMFRALFCCPVDMSMVDALASENGSSVGGECVKRSESSGRAKSTPAQYLQVRVGVTV